MNLWQRPHFVYRLYDDAGQLLYIGCTKDTHERFVQLFAARYADRHPNGELIRRTARAEITEYPDRRSAFAAERAAIRSESPLLNRQGVAS